jgi:hypothetical protein
MAAMPVAGNRQLVPFFQAETQSLRFVTSYSLEDAWRGRPQIAALQVIPGENAQGFRLIVNEIPYTGVAQAGAFVSGLERDAVGRMVTRYVPIVPGPGSFVLADRLSYCRFNYLEKRLIAPFDIWRPDWTLNQSYPVGIRIEMASLDTSPAELHATTITVPFKVTLPPGASYAQ